MKIQPCCVKHIITMAAIARARTDRMTYVKFLLMSGVQVNYDDPSIPTPLMTIICYGYKSLISKEDMQLCQLMLEAGCDMDKVMGWKHTDTGTALKMAVERGFTSVVQLLLEAGANPDVADDTYRVTPLLLAVATNQKDIAQLLIKYNCSLDSTGCLVKYFGYFPVSLLRCAIQCGHSDMAKLLVTSGCDISRDTYLWNNEEAPDYLVRNLQLWLFLKNAVSVPLTLIEICRRKIKKLLGYRIQDKLKSLYFPAPVSALLF